MILDSDWLLCFKTKSITNSNQSETSITSDQSNPSKLEPFKSYSKTSIVKLFYNIKVEWGHILLQLEHFSSSGLFSSPVQLFIFYLEWPSVALLSCKFIGNSVCVQNETFSRIEVVRFPFLVFFTKFLRCFDFFLSVYNNLKYGSRYQKFS